MMVCVCAISLCSNHLTGVIAYTNTNTYTSGMQFILFEFYCVTMTFCYTHTRSHTIILTILFTALTTDREKFRPHSILSPFPVHRILYACLFPCLPACLDE